MRQYRRAKRQNPSVRQRCLKTKFHEKYPAIKPILSWNNLEIERDLMTSSSSLSTDKMRIQMENPRIVLSRSLSAVQVCYCRLTQRDSLALFARQSSVPVAMKRKWVGKTLICLVGAFILSADGLANGDVHTNNPYAIIATRNIFGLQQQPASDSTMPHAPPLPKIALKGIMSVYGSRLVLIKVTMPRLGVHSIREKSCILKEGEVQDVIEVKRVDEKAGVVVFDNHGTVQEIKLGEAPKD